VTAFLLMAAGFGLAATVLSKRRASNSTRRAAARPLDWVAVLAGLSACEAVAFAARELGAVRLGLTSTAIVAAVVAAAGVAGYAVGWSVEQSSQNNKKDIAGLAQLFGVLLATPAFYYGIRLYVS